MSNNNVCHWTGWVELASPPEGERATLANFSLATNLSMFFLGRFWILYCVPWKKNSGKKWAYKSKKSSIHPLPKTTAKTFMSEKATLHYCWGLWLIINRIQFCTERARIVRWASWRKMVSWVRGKYWGEILFCKILLIALEDSDEIWVSSHQVSF